MYCKMRSCSACACILCHQLLRCCKSTSTAGDYESANGESVCWKITVSFRARRPREARNCRQFERSSPRTNGLQSCWCHFQPPPLLSSFSSFPLFNGSLGYRPGKNFGIKAVSFRALCPPNILIFFLFQEVSCGILRRQGCLWTPLS